jgi:hypothetical protein
MAASLGVRTGESRIQLCLEMAARELVGWLVS